MTVSAKCVFIFLIYFKVMILTILLQSFFFDMYKDLEYVVWHNAKDYEGKILVFL